MVTKTQYNEELVKAAHAVLLEVVQILGEYRDSVALVGGWCPVFLCPKDSQRHVGSLDVDLALDHRILAEVGYDTICNKLAEGGYRQSEEQPFIFYRTLNMNGKDFEVELDLLAGEYEGTGRNRRTQHIQDVKARKARGCDLVFNMFQEVEVSGTDPRGYRDSAKVKIPSIVPFLIMKANALADRRSDKDSYDIYFILRYCPEGLDAVVENFRQRLDNGLIREGLAKLRDKFASPDHVGPNIVADFEELEAGDEREMLKRDAYERVHYLLEQLDILDERP